MDEMELSPETLLLEIELWASEAQIVNRDDTVQILLAHIRGNVTELQLALEAMK